MAAKYLIVPLLAAVLPAQEAGASANGASANGASANRAEQAARLVVLNKAEASVSILDPQTGEELKLIKVGEGPHEAAVAPDGRRVVVCNYGGQKPGDTLTVFDAWNGKVLRTVQLLKMRKTAGGEERPARFFRPHGIRFLDAERFVVTSEVGGHLVVVKLAEKEPVIEGSIATRARASHMVAVRGDLAFVANIGSGSVSVLDLKKSQFVKEIETGDGCEGIEVRPGSRELWTTNRAANTLSIVDLDKLEVVKTLQTGEFPIRVAFTPDGAAALVSCARSGTVELWDAEARERRREIQMNEKPIEEAKGERLFAGQFGDSPVPVGILVSPDGAEAFIANTQADIITVLDLRKGRIARRLKTRAEPDGMAWIPAVKGG